MFTFGLLVCGSRSFVDYNEFCFVMDGALCNMNGVKVDIIAGGANGADSLAKRYAKEKGLGYHEFLADWSNEGKSAGYKRNCRMHDYLCDNYKFRGCLAFWDGNSRGTQHNFDLCVNKETPLQIWDFFSHNNMYTAKTSSNRIIELSTDGHIRVPVELPF